MLCTGFTIGQSAEYCRITVIEKDAVQQNGYLMKIIIRNALVVNEGIIRAADVYIANQRIEKVGSVIQLRKNQGYLEINAEGKYLLPESPMPMCTSGSRASLRKRIYVLSQELRWPGA
jgi:hypothetical protein